MSSLTGGFRGIPWILLIQGGVEFDESRRTHGEMYQAHVDAAANAVAELERRIRYRYSQRGPETQKR